MSLRRGLLVVAATVLAAAGPFDRGLGARPAPDEAPPPLPAVDLFVGTAAGHGSTLPGASMPFGMTQLTPLTRTMSGGGYVYGDNTITGFALARLSGSPCPNFGWPSILPLAGATSPAPTFTHANESAVPGYYSVLLSSGIEAEMTVTLRTGIFRFTFPGRGGYLVVPGTRLGARVFGGSAAVPGICGSPGGFPLHFVYEINAPLRVVAGMVHVASHVVLVKAGVSYVSVKNAILNLHTEDPGWDFASIRASAAAAWRDDLGVVDVGGGTAGARERFYTALYHSFLAPNTFSDVNGDYMGEDGRVHETTGWVDYTNISGWDVYRTEFPLLCLLQPAVAGDVVRSLLAAWRESGWLGKWPMAGAEQGLMVGDPADVMIAEAVAFGVTVPLKQALQAVLHGAMHAQPGPFFYASRNAAGYAERPGLAEYLKFGYIPLDDDDGVGIGGVSVSLEYALDDFAIARIAAAAGRGDVAAAMLARSRNWQRLLDPATGFLEPRYADGSFIPDFPLGSKNAPGYTEGTGSVYTWSVPQDLHDLVVAMGGDRAATGRLDHLVSRLTNGHGGAWNGSFLEMSNEPSFGIPWIYLWTDQPWKTGRVVRRIQSLFRLTPDGLPGDDDLGTMSAWYVWSMLGLYPEIPGVGGLAVIDAGFPRITIRSGTSWSIRGRAVPGSWISLDTGSDAAPPSFCRSATISSPCDSTP
jgi:putative alpha-1,2-mannosidase